MMAFINLFRLILWIIFITSGCSSSINLLNIAHRGASGMLPEHSAEAYLLGKYIKIISCSKYFFQFWGIRFKIFRKYAKQLSIRHIHVGVWGKNRPPAYCNYTMHILLKNILISIYFNIHSYRIICRKHDYASIVIFRL